MPGIPLKDPALRRARALQMMALRIRGKSYADIGAEFNVSIDTVERTLNYAKRAGLIASFEDQILQELVPAAIENFKKAMENGDTQVALEVFKGTGMLLRPKEKAEAAPEDESLEIYIRKIRGGSSDVSAVVEGSVRPYPALAPPPVAEGIFAVSREVDPASAEGPDPAAPSEGPGPAA